MGKTFETITELEERIHVATRQSLTAKAASSSARFWYLSYQCVLLLAIASFIVSIVVTVAHAQELPGNASTSTDAGIPGGWWAPTKVESKTAPRLVISMADPTQFGAPDSLRDPRVQLNSDQPVEPTEASIAGLPNFELTNGIVEEPSRSTDRVPLPPLSFLALLQSGYQNWDSILADSHSVTDANGVPAHPLMQVNYAGWHLPVTLYISPLTDDETR